MFIKAVDGCSEQNDYQSTSILLFLSVHHFRCSRGFSVSLQCFFWWPVQKTKQKKKWNLLNVPCFLLILATVNSTVQWQSRFLKRFPMCSILGSLAGSSGHCVGGLFSFCLVSFSLWSAASAEHVRVSFKRDVKGWTRVRILDFVSRYLVNLAVVRFNLNADSFFENNNI